MCEVRESTTATADCCSRKIYLFSTHGCNFLISTLPSRESARHATLNLINCDINRNLHDSYKLENQNHRANMTNLTLEVQLIFSFQIPLPCRFSLSLCLLNPFEIRAESLSLLAGWGGQSTCNRLAVHSRKLSFLAFNLVSWVNFNSITTD